MSDTHELIDSTIEKVLTRVDTLAEKLGIAAKEVWRFTVTAKMVEAKRDLYSAIAYMSLPLILWTWAAHVVMHSIPHDQEQVMVHKSVYTPIIPATPDKSGYATVTCSSNGPCVSSGSGLYQQTQEDTPEMIDKGLGFAGWLLILSAVICACLGLAFAYDAVDELFGALASAKTAEYDAYQDLISDWKD